MSRAPSSPSFRPPRSDRLKATMRSFDNLSLSTQPPPAPLSRSLQPTQDEISPGPQLDIPLVRYNSRTSRISLHFDPPSPDRNSPAPRRSDSTPYEDIHTLDDEGWQRVAKAGGIEELLKLGEGASGSVAKCRLRKSGQVFAIKVGLQIVLCDTDRLI